MTPSEFRNLALALADTKESRHMDHPDFRVSGKVFASMGYPDKSWGMVRLTPDQQMGYVARHPDAFVPVKGAWGRRGATGVILKTVKKAALRDALREAWLNIAVNHTLK
ncbi:MAG TPA: MmcQ/YjbR family DNA-binding protein [Bacteroidota bacterium]|nr:MmcQ/YjbR family DNA-binding protein [Bacteroidota bacterium]